MLEIDKLKTVLHFRHQLELCASYLTWLSISRGQTPALVPPLNLVPIVSAIVSQKMNPHEGRAHRFTREDGWRCNLSSTVILLLERVLLCPHIVIQQNSQR